MRNPHCRWAWKISKPVAAAAAGLVNNATGRRATTMTTVTATSSPADVPNGKSVDFYLPRRRSPRQRLIRTKTRRRFSSSAACAMYASRVHSLASIDYYYYYNHFIIYCVRRRGTSKDQILLLLFVLYANCALEVHPAFQIASQTQQSPLDRRTTIVLLTAAACSNRTAASIIYFH